jgi:L-aminopeptidase/D-esterase-like protein
VTRVTRSPRSGPTPRSEQRATAGERLPSIADVAGITVGHWSDAEARTGCTVVLTPPSTVASCEVRGGAPGTRGTDMLQPGTLIEGVNAVLLTGGSAFGLAAAGGVERYLEERGVGSQIGPVLVPSVAAAVIFDLGVGDPTRRPGSAEGYAACEAASADVAEGRVGAGTGATAAKLWGIERAVPAGVGSWSTVDGALVVGALFVVNAVGEIVDEDGEVLAGPVLAPGERREDLLPWPGPGNTTIGVVATNASLSKPDVRRLATVANDAVELAVRPAHTLYDGDTVFTLATGAVEAGYEAVARMTPGVVAEAIRRSVAP